MKTLFIVVLIASCIFAQVEFNYETDSLAVRAILDANGLTDVSVAEVTTTSGGRIVALDLSSRGLTVIPPDIGYLTALEDLRLRDNNITELPAELGNLTSLTFICVGNNDISTLPEGIGNLTELTGLHLNDNAFETLPDSIVNLENLTDLRLNNNNLDTNQLSVKGSFRGKNAFVKNEGAVNHDKWFTSH